LFTYRFLGLPPEHRLMCDAPALGTRTGDVEVTKERVGEQDQSRGMMALDADEEGMHEASLGPGRRTDPSSLDGYRWLQTRRIAAIQSNSSTEQRQQVP
jgi:hypothetical protein